MLQIKNIASSSKGNFYILRTPTETLLLECGINIKEIQQALDFDFSKVVGCLLTHEHQDHSKSVKQLTKRSVDVYSAAETFIKLGISSHRAKSVTTLEQFKVGGFTIMPFSVQHDAVAPLGYLIAHKEFGKLLFATDTYYIKYKFKRLNYIMIECNYSKKLLEGNTKLPSIVKKRLLTSHFNLENVCKFLSANDLSAVKEIHLLHLSDGNSDVKYFKKKIEGLTGLPVTIN